MRQGSETPDVIPINLPNDLAAAKDRVQFVNTSTNPIKPVTMDIRQLSSPTETRGFEIQQLRKACLIKSLLRPDEIGMTYTPLDRTVVGGATTAEPKSISTST